MSLLKMMECSSRPCERGLLHTNPDLAPTVWAPISVATHTAIIQLQLSRRKRVLIRVFFLVSLQQCVRLFPSTSARPEFRYTSRLHRRSLIHVPRIHRERSIFRSWAFVFGRIRPAPWAVFRHCLTPSIHLSIHCAYGTLRTFAIVRAVHTHQS